MEHENYQNNFSLNDLIETLQKVERSLEEVYDEVARVRSSYQRPIIIRELTKKIKAENISYLNPTIVSHLYPISRYEATLVLKELRNQGLVKTHEDDLYEDVRKWLKTETKISTSYLQRRFKIGYAIAAEILDRLEEDGLIGPQDGTKPRRVIE